MPTAFLYVSLQLPALLKVRASTSTFFIFHFPHSHPLIWICRPQPSGSRQTQRWRRKRACSLMCVVPLSSLRLCVGLPASIGTAGLKETDPGSTVWSGTGASPPQGSLGEWVPAEVCLNARGSVCPRLASLALMDMSVLLIAGMQEKKNVYTLFYAFIILRPCRATSHCPCALGEIFVLEKTVTALCIKAALSEIFMKDEALILAWNGKWGCIRESFKSSLRLTKCNWIKL